MRAPLRAGAVGLCLVLTAAVLTSAAPAGSGPGASWVDGRPGASAPGGRGSSVTVSTTGSRPVGDPPVGALPADEGIRELLSGAAPPLVETDESGRVASVVAQPGTTVANPTSGVDGFVRRYAAVFGLTEAYAAKRSRSAGLPGGDRVVRYQQVAGGVPVLGGEIVVTTDSRGRVLGVVAESTAAAPTTTVAAVAASAAGRSALAETARRFGFDASAVRVGASSLWLYDPSLIGAPGARGARPTWWVDVVGVSGDAVATVLVDATEGTITLALSATKEAGRDRIVCDLANARVDLDIASTYACTKTSPLGTQSSTRTETGAPKTGEVESTFVRLGAAYEFYQKTFRINSFDGLGAPLRATVRACYLAPSECPFPNAFWDGQQFVFGQGWATDDVVGHEYTHALIDNASQLFYAYQSGAINEAFADIFGEFIDQSYAGPVEDTSKLWLIGEDIPGGEIRDMADPGQLGQPAQYLDSNWYPGDGDSGGVHINSGVANHLAYLITEGGEYNSVPFLGIGTTKSKQLWYRTMTLLPSGANYFTLARVLTHACTELIGHMGFTRADCFTTVKLARNVVNLGQPDGSKLGCPILLAPKTTVFADDFEHELKWTLTPPATQLIPSLDIPVTYAASGKQALYGFVGGVATMIDPITLPSTADALNPIYSSFQAFPLGLSAIASAGGPNWQYDNVNDAPGWQNLVVGTAAGGDYNELSADLTSHAGETLRFRVRFFANPWPEWLIDDVAVVQCGSIGAPVDALSADRSGTSAEVTWLDQTGPSDHIELTYEPDIPGAPETLPGLSGVPVERSVVLTGLDPDTAYTVTVVWVNSADEPGRPATVRIPVHLAPACLVNTPTHRYFSASPRGRPIVDPCRQLNLPPKAPPG